jgi:hypothetical protein
VNDARLRPGPENIEPGQAPGGVVLRVYDFSGELLRERMLLVPADTLRLTHQAWDQIQALPRRSRRRGALVVVYDGDTGQRWTTEDFHRAGLQPGTRVQRR